MNLDDMQGTKKVMHALSLNESYKILFSFGF